MKAFWVSAFAVAMLASAMPASRADNAEPQWRYSSSLLDEPKYPADFKHYDYVNPDAPKGGTLNLVAVGNFRQPQSICGAGCFRRWPVRFRWRDALRYADGGFAGSGIDAISAHRQRPAISRRFLLGQIQAPIPMRNGMTASRSPSMT